MRNWARCICGRYSISFGLAACAAGLFPTVAHAQTQPELVRVPSTTVTFELRPIPAGSIEIQGRKQNVPAFSVAATEVTWDLYDVYLFALDVARDEEDADGISRPSKPYVPPDRGYGHKGYPAMGMTRHAAIQFCEWLSRKTGDRYRLPTRIEWMYLAESGTPSAVLENWNAENADYSTHPVGTKKPNAWGLHDIVGNVAEWVAPDSSDQNDAPPIAMGGSYLDGKADCTTRSIKTQSSGWNASDPQIPKSTWWLADCDFVGFRFVREIHEETE